MLTESIEVSKKKGNRQRGNRQGGRKKAQRHKGTKKERKMKRANAIDWKR